jgi:TPR repeat protein
VRTTPTICFLLLFVVSACVSQQPAQLGAKREPLADIRAKAEQGNALAQCELGCRYHFGEGVASNSFEAVKWFRKAADQNQADAQLNLGVCYANGQGVAKDEVEAVKWFRKAVDQNLPTAHYNLGSCYAHGRGVARDEVMAIDLYRKAGEGGEASGFNGLAWILATSQNPEIRNGPSAIFFAEKAVAATKRKEPKCLDTLAAAYAEVGEFDKAAKTQIEAIPHVHTKAEKKDYRARLKLYEAKQPYRSKD